MEPCGSIKASGIRGSSFRPTQIEPALLATAKQFLENFQFDTRIRQLLHEDKMEQSIGKHKYYILGHEQKYEPGFLLIQKGQPIVFLSGRLQYGYSLRMRVHSSLFEQGAVFIGTLDTIFATFRLEDVWWWKGRATYTEPYSKRYDVLHTFVSTQFVQDKHLSGFTVEVAKLYPLSDLKRIVESKEFYSLDFIAEHGGRRRWHLPLAFTHQQVKAEMAPFQQKGPEKTLVEKVIPAVAAVAPSADTKYTEAIARRIVGLPDTYALQSKTNVDLGRAAVQTAGVSMLLRSEFQTKKRESVVVSIQWYEEFQRYKITGLVSAE
jgi:hypothetical protein